jgi:hypothetical protein
MTPKREQVLKGATVNANNTYGPFNNLGSSNNPALIVDVFSTGATGTSPTLTITVEVVDDAGHVYDLANPIALTNSTLSGRQVYTPIFEGQYNIKAVVGGTSPVFNGVDINVYMSSNDQ